MLGLQYQSLKTVLQHMDANSKIRISLHMPSIKNVEKMLPLKMNHLEIDDNYTKVDDTSYALSILRYDPDGNTPESIKDENRWRGSQYDFDEFGFPVQLGSDVLLPGDVSFQSEFRPGVEFDTEAKEREYRDDLRIHEKALEKQTDLRLKGETVNDYLKSLEPLPRHDLGEEYRIRQALNCSSKALKYSIEEDKIKLLPFECRRNNTKSPFKCCVQLIISKWCSMKKKSTQQFQRFEYTKRLFEASKCLHEVLFGGRTMPISIGRFNLAYLSPYNNAICRLPFSFRMQVNKVEAHDGLVAHDSFHLLVANSESLNSLWLNHVFDPNVFQRQVVRNAKNLVIDNVMKHRIQELLQTITTLPNPNISLLPLNPDFSMEDYFQLVQAWLNGDRQVGSSCSIGMENEKVARDVLKLVRIRNENTKRTKRCVTISRNDRTKVEIYYVSFKGPVTLTSFWWYWSEKWIMKIRIVKV